MVIPCKREVFPKRLRFWLSTFKMFSSNVSLCSEILNWRDQTRSTFFDILILIMELIPAIYLCSPIPNWAPPRENLSSGFFCQVRLKPATCSGTETRALKFHLKQVEVLYYPGNEQQRSWSDWADVQTDLRLCCSHMAKTCFLLM